jgi:23S rRNA (cytosine1962-C5)-methyltransferase
LSTPLKLTAKAMRRLESGHLWVYSDELTGAGPEQHAGVAELKDPQGKFFGFGFFSSHSKIAVRILTRAPQIPDRIFFKDRIRAAGLRRKDKISAHGAVRLVNGEADLLPGLVADWYAGQVVLQCLAPGVDKLSEMFAELFWEEFAPQGLWFRNDASGRELEGLPLEKFFWRGKEARELVVEESGVKYFIDLLEGHKTGAYLDQAENRVRAGQLASGRCLDAFCFQGGFALHLAKRADEVVAVDSSAPALSVLDKNLGLNKITNCQLIRENVFDILPVMAEQGERFKLIALDPPPLARKKSDLVGARKAYHELNRRAISLLEPHGVLLTYSCSFNFALSELLQTAQNAAAEQGRQARLIEIQTQAQDHPVLLSMPETFYLKGLVLEFD